MLELSAADLWVGWSWLSVVLLTVAVGTLLISAAFTVAACLILAPLSLALHVAKLRTWLKNQDRMKNAGLSRQVHRDIMNALVDGAKTTRELETVIEYQGELIKRVNDLKAMGWIVDTGERRDEAGRKNIVWGLPA